MRTDREAVSPIVAVILLLLVTVVLATTVFIVASNLVQNVRPAPFVGLAVTASNGTRTVIRVAAVSDSSLELAGLRSALLIDGATDATSTLSPLASGTAGRVTFGSADLRLNGGDEFTVVVEPGHTYGLVILEADGASMIGSLDWST